MDKADFVSRVYEITTLTHVTDEILHLLTPLPMERTLELLLLIRQQQKPVKSPLNFLRRAVVENWTAETLPQKVNRHLQNMEENLYLRRGHSPEEAQRLARESNNININNNINKV